MSIFSKVGGLKPGLTAFNLSHTNLFDCNFGQLVPIACLETLPGDVFKLDADVVGRLTSALKSPILSEMDIVLEAFYTPTRLLMGRDANFPTPVGEVTFEEFLSGGQDGSHIGSNSYPLPTFDSRRTEAVSDYFFHTGGIGDYLGVQTNTPFKFKDFPLVFPWRAYRWIWNEYYRDENLMDPVQVCSYLGNGVWGEDPSLIYLSAYDSLLYRCWRKDYFTSALPFQQRGTSPALPISGVLPVNLSTLGVSDLSFSSVSDSGVTGLTFSLAGKRLGNDSTLTNVGDIEYIGSKAVPQNYDTSFILSRLSGDASSSVGTVDLSNAATFDVNQIRTAFQVQKWLERNARGGVRKNASP